MARQAANNFSRNAVYPSKMSASPFADASRVRRNDAIIHRGNSRGSDREGTVKLWLVFDADGEYVRFLTEATLAKFFADNRNGLYFPVEVRGGGYDD